MQQSTSTSQCPLALPQFSGIARMWDAREGICVSKILPGEYYVTPHAELITTVLGSCVSACVRDPITGVGGMNHFMLPGDSTRPLDKWAGGDALATRFGIAAMETLINDILKQGARKSRLEVKLFGGGKVLDMELNDVGGRNIQFAREFIESEGLEVVSEDLGGTYPRKVNYFPATGKVMMRKLRSVHNQTIAKSEERYKKVIADKPAAGEIELFS